MISDTFLMVHYSLSFSDAGRVGGLVRQLDISLTTLRVHNPRVAVVVFCHGETPTPLRAVAARHDAQILERLRPIDRLGDELGPVGRILGRFGPVHKFLNLGSLAQHPADTTLYLDADTVVFSDLRRLVPATDAPRLIAREEVGSERCHYGVDRDYLDEHALRKAVRAAGGRPPAPAFNTGVMMFHRLPRDRAERIERRYLAWLTRFAIWMADHPSNADPSRYADVFDLDALAGLLDSPDGERVRRLAVAYPSINRWLAEEAAAWVAFGHERDIAIEGFDRRVVAQGGEPLDGPLPRAVWHYFSTGADRMEHRLGLRTGHSARQEPNDDRSVGTARRSEPLTTARVRPPRLRERSSQERNELQAATVASTPRQGDPNPRPDNPTGGSAQPTPVG